MMYQIEVQYPRDEWQAADATDDWETAGNILRAWFAKGFNVRVIVERKP